MDTLANEVKAIRVLLIVDEFEVDDPLKKQLVRLGQLFL